jgi:hypothetical protein
MTAGLIAQLILALGPVALELIPKLQKLWTKPSLTDQEVIDLCEPTKIAYDEYIATERASRSMA